MLDLIYAIKDMAADYVMNPTMLYLLILAAIALQLASLFVPYYSDASGIYGVFKVDDKVGVECLGAPSSGEVDECAVNKTLPLLAVSFGVLALIAMGATDTHFSAADPGQLKKFPIFKQFFEGLGAWNISGCVLLLLAVCFSIATFSFQMGHPLNDGTRTNLADKETCGENATKFEPGMALSAAAMACFIIVGISVSGLTIWNTEKIGVNCSSKWLKPGYRRM